MPGGESATDSRPALSVIVPTRNESRSVRELSERTAAHLGDEGVTWEILFVDDSDDDTPEVIRTLAAEGWPIRLHHRPAEERVGGLAGALAEGLIRGRAEVLAVMDADLQHPPEVLGPLTGPLRSGEADLASGSRYIPGGDASGLQTRWRRMVSKGSRAVTHLVFPETRLATDPGSGLFALNQRVIEGVELRPDGFKMLTEILIRGRWTTLHQTPYRFAGRMYGASKASLIHGYRFFHHLGRLWSDTRVHHRDLLKPPGDLRAFDHRSVTEDARTTRGLPGSG